MHPYTAHEFQIPELTGISKKTVEEHIKLYQGYVKNYNGIMEKLLELMKDPEKNAFVIGELHRRIGFEFNGMRNHEYYFHSLEGGAKPLPADATFKAAIEKEAGSMEAFIGGFTVLATTRGIGWAILYWDKHVGQFVPTWVDEQHLGQLNGLAPVLMLDMWEHSYLMDYTPGEKKKYIQAFFANLNWEVIEENFKKAQ